MAMYNCPNCNSPWVQYDARARAFLCLGRGPLCLFSAEREEVDYILGQRGHEFDARRGILSNVFYWRIPEDVMNQTLADIKACREARRNDSQFV